MHKILAKELLRSIIRLSIRLWGILTIYKLGESRLISPYIIKREHLISLIILIPGENHETV